MRRVELIEAEDIHAAPRKMIRSGGTHRSKAKYGDIIQDEVRVFRHFAGAM
jgi:hypothetical protein